MTDKILVGILILIVAVGLHLIHSKFFSNYEISSLKGYKKWIFFLWYYL